MSSHTADAEETRTAFFYGIFPRTSHKIMNFSNANILSTPGTLVSLASLSTAHFPLL